ncbi:hypothetical protein QZJ86_05750 [Methylomonas montana]|uniref:helix-turn-helix transcriptional regulator n=1 Tax=Methylomonas montana TaxID=3058963 RepID=UPI00265AB0C3|nr:hypothetical protein [Methylomonas montana]WKJ91638.1 hypothetical protein QZJ86_05750 [Methylomonas montana]
MASQAAALPTLNPLYRRPIVEKVYGKSRGTIYREIDAGLFVRPVVIGRDKNGDPCQVAWPGDEVQAIIDARIAGKTDAEIKALVVKLEAARGSK